VALVALCHHGFGVDRHATLALNSHFYWRKPVFWSRSYGIITVGGIPLTVLKQYIENTPD